MFEASKTYGLFTTYFDEELYHHAAFYYETHTHRSNWNIYAIVGIARVLEDVEISQRNYQPYQDVQRFIERDFYRIKANDNANIVNNFKRYFTATIHIKLASLDGDFQILSISDDNNKIDKPGYMNINGIGYRIHSYVGKLEFVTKADVDGQIHLQLRGLDISDPEDRTKRIPFWIDYTKLTVNGETIFDTVTPAWHGKPYNYKIDAKADEEIKIQVEWLPHRSDT